ncbi:hypothetical protein GOV09_00770 [Candidatus Woesearchaeota archaeon]|nr:hypothetical protein [Candidatus Woesearchaeota archaeon]
MLLKQRPDLMAQIRKGVAEHHPGRLEQLEATMASYTGDAHALEQWLLTFDSDDPWIASENAILTGDIRRKKEEGEQPIAKSDASGQDVYRQLFVFQSKTTGLTWKAGSQGSLKVLETWGTPELRAKYDPEQKAQTAKEKKQQWSETIGDIPSTLEEILQDPSTVKDVLTLELRKRLYKILDLEEIKSRLRDLDQTIHGELAFVDPTKTSSLLSMAPNGRIFGWLRRQYETLPEEIKDLLTSVESSIVSMSDSDRKLKMGALMIYAAREMPINRDAAIGGYLRDFDYLTELTLDDPDSGYDQPNLYRIRDIIRREEITLLDIPRILQAPTLGKKNIRQARIEINKKYFSRFKKEIATGVGELTSLFMKDGKWLPDAYRLEVPVKRLEDTEYWTPLMQGDFKAVMSYLRLKTLSRTEQYFPGAQSIVEFKDTVDNMTLTIRKVKYWKEEGKPLPRVKNYRIAENFKAKHGMSIDEFIGRAQDALPENKEWRKISGKVEDENKFGLYQDTKEIQAIVTEARKAIASTDITELLKDTRFVLTHPLAFEVKQSIPEKQYYTPEEVQLIKQIAPISKKLPRGELDEAAVQQRKDYEGANLFQGTLTSVKRPRLGFGDSEQLVIDRERKMSYLDPQRWQEQLRDFNDRFEKPTEEWAKKAAYLGSNGSGYLKQAAQVETNNTTTFFFGLNTQQDYVEKSLVKEVEEAYKKLEEHIQVQKTVMEDFVKLSKAQLYDAFTVHVKNTSPQDGGRFARTFGRRFEFRRDHWESRSPMSKGEIIGLTYELHDYNKEHRRELRLEI